uniref:Uncharacterized protein n=1 Tax=viral metagenome TaxID=1070528 RepID=A0A6C0J8D1_9ZZZZ
MVTKSLKKGEMKEKIVEPPKEKEQPKESPKVVSEESTLDVEEKDVKRSKRVKDEDSSNYITKGKLNKMLKIINPNVRIGKNVIKALDAEIEEIILNQFDMLEYDSEKDSLKLLSKSENLNQFSILPTTFGKVIKVRLMERFPTIKKINPLLINELQLLIENDILDLLKYYIYLMDKRRTLYTREIECTNKNIKIQWNKRKHNCNVDR